MTEHLSDRVLTPGIPRPQPDPSFRRIPGWKLSGLYRQTASQRALTAADLAGGAIVERFTWSEAARVTGSNSRYLSIARSLSAQERAMVEAGTFTLSGIVHARRKWASEIAKIA